MGLGKAQLLLGTPSPAGLGFHLVSGIHYPQGPSHYKGALWSLNIPSLTWGFTPVTIFQKEKLRSSPTFLTSFSPPQTGQPILSIPCLFLAPHNSQESSLYFSELESEACPLTLGLHHG